MFGDGCFPKACGLPQSQGGDPHSQRQEVLFVTDDEGEGQETVLTQDSPVALTFVCI